MLIKDFFSYAIKLLDTQSPDVACPQLVRVLPSVLRDPATLKQITTKGRMTLFERVGGLTILGHHHPESVHSQPHDHGRTWAIYGVVTGRTAMHNYAKIDSKNVKLTSSYWITPGQAHWFPTGAIHSHQTFNDSTLIRLEGFNLWRCELKPGGHRYTWIKDA